MDQTNEIRAANERLLIAFCTFLLTEKMVARNTLSAYRSDLEQFLTFLTAHNCSIIQVTSTEIRNFIAHLREKKVSPRSSSRKLSAIKLFFVYLSERNGFENAAQHVLLPSIEKKLPQYLTEKEIEDLLRATHMDDSRRGMRNRVIIYLLYATGMRISELAQLKYADIDLQAATIMLQGKGGKQRIVPLPEPVCQIVAQYIKICTNNTLIEVDYLFATQYAGKSKPITRQALWHIIQNVWSKTGNSRTISPHMLRHSMATHMLKNGAHLRSLQMILGHESLATVQFYTHVETSYVRSIYNKKHPRS